MNLRTTIILLIVFALLGAYIYFFERGEFKTKEEKEVEILKFAKKDLIKLELNNENGKILCVKDSSNQWRINSPVLADVDTLELNGLISRLSDLSGIRAISKEISSLSSYGLDSPQIKIILTLKEKKQTINEKILLIGNENPTQTGYYAILKSENKKEQSQKLFLISSYIVDSNFRKKVYDLRDKTAIAFNKDAVSKIEFHYPDSTIIIQRDTAENWRIIKPINYKGNNNEITDIISNLHNLKIKNFEVEKTDSLSLYGLPGIKVVIETLEPSTLNSKLLINELWIGKNKTKDRIYAKQKSKDAIFLVAEEDIKKILKNLYYLRDRFVSDINDDDVQRLTIFCNDSTLVCIKDTSDNWHIKSPIDTLADNVEMRTILSRIENWTVRDFASDVNNPNLKDYGLDKPFMKIIAEIGNHTKVLLVGNNPPNDTTAYYVKRDEDDNIFIVSSWLVEDLQKMVRKPPIKKK